MKASPADVATASGEVERMRKGISVMNQEIAKAYEGLSSAETALRKVDQFLTRIQSVLEEAQK